MDTNGREIFKEVNRPWGNILEQGIEALWRTSSVIRVYSRPFAVDLGMPAELSLQMAETSRDVFCSLAQDR